MLIYYVYAYINRKTGIPYYIGKGKGNRAYDKKNHITSVPNDHMYIRILEKNLTEIGAYAIERRLIRFYGRKNIDENGVLRNILEGGQGGKQPDSILKIISKKAKVQQKKLVESGKHHFLGGEIARKVIEDGKHPMHNEKIKNCVISKMTKTKNSEEWKNSIGKEATRKRLEKINFKGENNPRAIPVVIYNVRYGTIREASRFLPISEPTIRKRLNDKSNKDFIYGEI